MEDPTRQASASEASGGHDSNHAIDLSRIDRLDDQLSPQYLEFHGVLPVAVEGDRLLVATWLESVGRGPLDELRFRFGAEPSLVVVQEADARAAIRRAYGDEATTAEALIEGLHDGSASRLGEDAPAGAIDDLLAQANEAPVVRLVHMLIAEAIDGGASDIHLEQTEAGIRCRYRVDGVLLDTPTLPRHLSSAIISRIKVMAKLDIAERRLPQDGRIRLPLRDRMVDARVSTLPVLHGESVVLRLLDKRAQRISLGALGMPETVRASFLQAASQPNGILLVTGPTGSGKTTTLYAVLDAIRTGREKILTVEDPVEYELEGVAQVPVNPKVGLTFARALRSLLRQDPDILMVGEIRDQETAEIATHAALTGHLVLSTLHTNDACSAVMRLEDLGVPAFLVASTLHGVLAQRLVRRTCQQCGGWPKRASAWRKPGTEPPPSRGCEACGQTGFQGRVGVFEYMRVDAELREHIHAAHTSTSLRQIALRHGMRSLRESARVLVEDGATTRAEVTRVLGPTT